MFIINSSVMKASPCIRYSFALLLFLTCYSTTAQPPFEFDHPTANLSTSWSNTDQSLTVYDNSSDTSRVQAILTRRLFGGEFACGFYCDGNCTSSLFAVVIVSDTRSPQMVWSANRDHPVSYGAILNLTATGELVLVDADGSTVWTTNTTGKTVAGLNLTDDGNLVVFDTNRQLVWQSFDYPTDCLVPRQALFQGQQLIPSVSSTNWTTQKDLFSLKMTDKGLVAYVGSNPPQAYYSSRSYDVYDNYTNTTGRRYVRLLNGSLSLFIHSVEPSDPDGVITIPQASSAQYMKLMPDGHLRVFQWKAGWSEVADLFTDDYLEECNYPMACGRYGICSGNQQCSCPVSSSPRVEYFKAEDDRQPALGCSEITPLTCNATQDQVFIELENVTYFNILVDMKSVDMDTCKRACVNNCSCKAAIFRYDFAASTPFYNRGLFFTFGGFHNDKC
ncbi:hypothetical protein SSX86_020629 [Deinandra increscens subsp. villosa]|uniref:Uncharacterized protein n=1 Tax=Deinandra increscens subsp. villosa TaxID=3103831 RepID=A0AAP0GUW1_9ASTR